MGPKIGCSMKKVATDQLKRHIDTKDKMGKNKGYKLFYV